MQKSVARDFGDYLGGAVEHWQGVYARVVDDLKEHLEPPQRGWRWPNDWFAYSNDSYYDYYGHHRNQWRQFDAVIAQLQQRTQMIVNEYGHDVDSQQGIQQWRQLMMPFVTDLECFSCGSMYQKRVTIFSHDPGVPECECNPCIETVAANHEQMLAHYLNTLSPRSREIEEQMAQPRHRRFKRRHRIPELWEPRHRQRI